MKALLFSVSLFLVGCTSNTPTLKVAATLVPHAQMLEVAKSDLADQNIDLEIVTIEDYQTPNRALADGEVDANFFQHEPFLKAQIDQFHYPLVSVAKIHIEPLGGYSIKVKNINDLKDGAKIALPLDPTNQARALLLLQQNHLLTLHSKDLPTLLDIKENPHHLQFIEVDAAMLARTLEDADISLIPTNYALQTGFNPKVDALFLEDAASPYANILVVRQGDESKEDIKALIAALKSKKMEAFLKEHFGDSILLVN